MLVSFAGNASDTTSLGRGVLHPSEAVISEQAGGMFELRVVHPIDSDGLANLLEPMSLIKAPAPVREAPYTSYAQPDTTITRKTYEVVTTVKRLYLRTEASTSSKALQAYDPGTQVVELADAGSDATHEWLKVQVVNGGAIGYMAKREKYDGVWYTYLNLISTTTERISGDNPGSVIKPVQARDQLFRITQVERDAAMQTVTAYAQHIFYDLRGMVVNGEYKPDNVNADDVVDYVMAHTLPVNNGKFTVFSGIADKPITADYSGRNVVDILLNPEDGILAQTGGRIIRDNYSVYIIAGDTDRDLGIRIARGKNLLAANLRTDSSNIITRIIPVGRNKDGSPLYLVRTPPCVDSSHINDYPLVMAQQIEYDVQVSDEMTITQARNKLAELAQADFDVNGVDLPTVSLDTDFVRVELLPEYKRIANLAALHMYDTCKVTDEFTSIFATLRMTSYTYDCLLERYTDTGLGELTDLQPTVYGYEIGGTINGTKILPGSIGAGKIGAASITAGTIAANAITAGTVAANAITSGTIAAGAIVSENIQAGEIKTENLHARAVTAEKIASGTITANEIHADAITTTKIRAGQVTADKLDAESVSAVYAHITDAKIDNANIDTAHVVDLTADNFITHDAVADKYFIDKLQVRNLQVIEQTVGSLIIKATNGKYYRLDVDASTGSLTPTQVSVSSGEIAAGVTSDGLRSIIETDLTVTDLAASSIKAINALIDKITAARIDVDELFAREGTISQLNAHNIRSISVGGRNLIRRSMTFEAPESGNADADGDFWRFGSGFSYAANVTKRAGSLMRRLNLSYTGGSTTTVRTISSPVWDVTDDSFYGRKLTFSAWIRSNAWASLDNPVRVRICMNASGTDRTYTLDQQIVVSGAWADGIMHEEGKNPSASYWRKFWFTFTVDTNTFSYSGEESSPPALSTMTRMFVQFVLRGNGDYRVHSPMLEFGTYPSDWSEAPAEFQTGSRITLTDNMTKITTPVFEVDVSGQNGDMKLDETGANFNTLTVAVLVDRNKDIARKFGDNTNSSSITINVPADASLKDALDSLSNRIITKNVTINVAAGQYAGDYVLEGISGKGIITISGVTDGGTSRINGSLLLNGCSSAVIVSNMTIISSQSKAFVARADACVMVRFNNCVLNGGVNGNGFFATDVLSLRYGTVCWINGTTLKDSTTNLINANYTTRVYVQNCVGGASGKPWIYCDAAIVQASGTAPLGTVSQHHACILEPAGLSGLTQTAGGASPTPTETATTTLNCTTSHSYLSGAGWQSDYLIYQGKYAGQTYMGCFWFSGLSGQTIKAARLTLTRQRSGASGAVKIHLYGITTAEGSGDPRTGCIDYGELPATLTEGQTVTVTVPTAAVQAVATGTTYKGFALYLPNDPDAYGHEYSQNFAAFYGSDSSANKPKLEITYEA